MTIRLSAFLGACALATAGSFALLAQQADAAGAAPVVMRDAQAAPTTQPPQRRFIIRYRTGTLQRTSTTAALTAARASVTRSGIAASIPNLTVRHVRRMSSGADVIALSRGLDAAATASLLRTIAADPNVAFVQPDRRMQHNGIAPSLMPNDPLSAQYQWHFYDSVGGIKAPAAWDNANGAGVVVAVLDTGVTDHPDLAPNLLPGYDFISDAFVSRRATDERVAGAHDYGDWNDDIEQCPVGGSSFHGTHTAGTVGEVSNNAIGMAGVAHGAKVLPVRVLGRCGGYTSDIADAIIWASGGSVPGVPNNPTPAEVINMSLGGEFMCDDVMQGAIDTALANGTTVVVSAGNSNANASAFSPASCAGVITVGATRVNGGKAFYSNFGKIVDLSAPGGGGGQDPGALGYVWSTINDSTTAPELGNATYGGMAGTSMAAPHVAAVAALVQSKAATPLTPAQMEALLKSTARTFPVTIPGTQPMGAGILDAKAALAAVLPPCQGSDCESNAVVLTNKVPMRNLSGAQNAELAFAIDVPVGATGLSFLTYGGTGDVTLLVRYAQMPTLNEYDLSSVHAGNNETVRVTVARGGRYYVKVVGAKAFNAVTMEARFN